MKTILVVFALALFAVAVAAAYPHAICGYIMAVKAAQNASISGGAAGNGTDLSDAPFITWDWNASLNNETPITALTRSVIPSLADNASLSVGNASFWWLGGYFSSLYTGSLCLAGDCRATAQFSDPLGGMRSASSAAVGVILWSTTRPTVAPIAWPIATEDRPRTAPPTRALVLIRKSLRFIRFLPFSHFLELVKA